MKITFLRHGALLSPYDNYNSLTLSALSQLARQDIDPSIDPSKIFDQLTHANHILRRYDALFVSESQRTSDTACKLAKKIKLPTQVKLKELNEILFDPSKLVTETEYQNDKLVIIRQKLFESLVNDSNLESGKKVIDRVHKLNQILKLSDGDSVLVITHGFFMRYLDIFYRQKSLDFSEAALNQAINYDYTSGFTVIID
jgi:broad specificity phosphatase PhoE